MNPGFRPIQIAVFLVAIATLSIVPRSEFALLFGLYTAAFAMYAMALIKWNLLSIRGLLLIYIATRLPWFFSLPNLSDDYFRFLWDGLLILHGYNPLSILPNEVNFHQLGDEAIAAHLLNKMNSPGYFSVYPPLHQAVFAAGAYFTNFAIGDLSARILAGVNAMRMSIVLAELGMIAIFRNNARYAGAVIPAYLLNPLVIAEGAGNVHFEALLVPFLAIALRTVHKQKYIPSAFAWCAAILVKLTPAMLYPALVSRIRKKEISKFTLLCSMLLLAASMPFILSIDSFGMHKGLDLYFRHFEFNASVYYLANAVGTFITGYNTIAITGPVLAILTVLSVLFVSFRFRKSSVAEVALVVYLIFYLLSTTVHPWYIITIAYLAIASGRFLLLIWSWAICLSYSIYSLDSTLNFALIGTEYVLLLSALVLEHRKKSWLRTGMISAE